MQGVSLGLHGWSRNWGQVHQAHGRKSHEESTPSTDATSNGGVTSANKLVGISTSITNLRSQLNSLTSADTSDSSAVSSAASFDAQIVSKQRGELQIHTKEGDLITLRFSNKVAAAVSSQQSTQGGTTQQSTSIDLHSRSRVSVEIKGDLNSDELAAVNDLVGKVSDLASQFYGGDVGATLTQATNLSYDTTQLADYSLNLHLKQSIRAYAQQVQLSPPAPAPVPVPAPTVPVVGVVPAEVPTADAAPEAVPAEVTPVEAAPADPDSSPAVAEAPVGAVASSNTEPAAATPATTTADAPPASTDENSTTPVANPPAATTTQTLSEFVARVRSIFSIQQGDASLGFSYDFKVRLLIASIASSAPATAAESSAPAASAA